MSQQLPARQSSVLHSHVEFRMISSNVFHQFTVTSRVETRLPLIKITLGCFLITTTHDVNANRKLASLYLGKQSLPNQMKLDPVYSPYTSYLFHQARRVALHLHASRNSFNEPVTQTQQSLCLVRSCFFTRPSPSWSSPLPKCYFTN